jgi:hypothetical protein
MSRNSHIVDHPRSYSLSLSSVMLDITVNFTHLVNQQSHRDRKLLEVVERVAKEELESEHWLREARLSYRSYRGETEVRGEAAHSPLFLLEAARSLVTQDGDHQDPRILTGAKLTSSGARRGRVRSYSLRARFSVGYPSHSRGKHAGGGMPPPAQAQEAPAPST